MSTRRLLVFFIGLFACSLESLNAQSYAGDSTSLKTTVLQYQQTLNHDMSVYSGPEYIWAYPKSVGHPFFLTDTMQRGLVVYDGIAYYDLPILFEMVQQEVLLEGVEKLRIKLNKEKVEAFTLKGHPFRWLEADATLSSGFYECVYDKEIKVFVKHLKEPRPQFNPEDPYVFKETSSYYVQKAGVNYSIGSQDDLVEVLGDKKKLVKDYWKQNKLSFKKNPEETIINTIEFYTRVN